MYDLQYSLPDFLGILLADVGEGLIHPCSLLIRNINSGRFVAIEFLSQGFNTHDQQGVG